MKKLSLLLLVSTFVFCGCSNDDDDAKTYVLSLPNYESETLNMGDIKNPDKKWNDEWANPYILNLLTDNNKIFEFDCQAVSYDAGVTFGFGSDSFAFTNGTTGNYSAMTKKGVNNNTYIVVGASGMDKVSIRFKDNENLNKTEDYQVKGLYVTNSTFGYTSMKEGTSLFSGEDKFGNSDSFKVIIYNLDKTRNVECFLAEGTNFVTTWKWVDLTALGETEGLRFEMKTTKTTKNGAMTPTYFCLDGITITDN